jgi:hypothetical protein
MTTPRLNIPFLLPSQAQKHVTVNTALSKIDALVQLNAISSETASPPSSPADGDTYLVPALATGDWAGHSESIAIFDEDTWTFIAPSNGWLCYVTETDGLYRYLDGWNLAPLADSVDQLGINGTADATNRLLVQSEGVLFNHLGTDQRTTLNKASTADDAALSYQTGFSSRALTGLLADDNYTIKVSPDGTNFAYGLGIDNSTGQIALGQMPNYTASVTIHDATTPKLGLLTDAEDDVTLGFYDAKAPNSENCELIWSAADNGLSINTNSIPALQIAANGTVSTPQMPVISVNRYQDLSWGSNTTEQVSFQRQRILQGNISINGAQDQITIQEGGVYSVSIIITFRSGQQNSSDNFFIELRQNGTNVIPSGSNICCPNHSSTANTKVAYSVTLPIVANVADVLEFWVTSIHSNVTVDGASLDIFKVT